MKCVACRLGWSWECSNAGRCTNNIVSTSDDIRNSDDLLPSEDMLGSGEGDVEYIPGKPEKEINTYKEDSVIRDQQSTGRKRAAYAYPLHPDKPCEWQGKKNVGGNIPITGCINGMQQARHHGPDKNTLNNEEGNVHRICHKCHNRWHTVNDPDYVWGANHEPHSPTSATPLELLENEMHWSTRSTVKAKD